ncbi:MAG: AAC(3) family N-acetyltransferase [Desulfovibrionaceae bacterium]
MRVVDPQSIADGLRAVGLGPGDVVFVYSDLRPIGPLKGANSRDAFCRVYLEAFQTVIGASGTLVVPTYTTQVARYDADFIWEETPAITGLFSEYVRQLPESLRSLHPLNSVCALGAKQEYLCSDNGPSEFGYDSPFQRLLHLGAKIVALGLESGYAVGIAHHLEVACCLPYVYNKLLKWKTVVNGKPLDRLFFASRRHLQLEVRYDLSRLAAACRARGLLQSARLGGHWVHGAPYDKVFAVGTELLRDDPFALLRKPPVFTYGEIPFDGPTGGREANRDTPVESPGTQAVLGHYLTVRSKVGDDLDSAEEEQANP